MRKTMKKTTKAKPKIRATLTEREAITTALGMGAAYAATLKSKNPKLAAKLQRFIARARAKDWRKRVEDLPPFRWRTQPPPFVRAVHDEGQITALEACVILVTTEWVHHLNLWNRFWLGFNCALTGFDRPRARPKNEHTESFEEQRDRIRAVSEKRKAARRHLRVVHPLGGDQ